MEKTEHHGQSTLGLIFNSNNMRRLILIPLIALCGCNVQKRQIEKMQVFALRYPNELARLSDLLNPCFDGTAKSDTVIKVDTINLTGTTTTVNTVYVKGKADTIIKTITIQLPGKIVNRTVTIRDTVKDGRSEAYLNSQLQVKSDSLVKVTTILSQVKKDRNVWRLIAIGALLIIMTYIIITVYKFFTTGGLSSLKSIIK